MSCCCCSVVDMTHRFSSVAWAAAWVALSEVARASAVAARPRMTRDDSIGILEFTAFISGDGAQAHKTEIYPRPLVKLPGRRGTSQNGPPDQLTLQWRRCR